MEKFISKLVLIAYASVLISLLASWILPAFFTFSYKIMIIIWVFRIIPLIPIAILVVLRVVFKQPIGPGSK